MSDPSNPTPGPYGPPPQQKQKGGCLRWIGIVTVAFVALIIVGSIIGVAASGGGDDDDTSSDTTEAATDDGPQTNSGNTENPPTDDVELAECGPGVGNVGGNFIGAAGTITNHSSEPSDYMITVEFTADGTRYTESFSSASAIAPNQSAEWSALTVDEARPNTECNITSVERFAS